MFGNTTPIERNKLLAEANEIIRQHEDYLHGMQATEVEQKGPVLVFRGEFYGCGRFTDSENNRSI